MVPLRARGPRSRPEQPSTRTSESRLRYSSSRSSSQSISRSLLPTGSPRSSGPASKVRSDKESKQPDHKVRGKRICGWGIKASCPPEPRQEAEPHRNRDECENSAYPPPRSSSQNSPQEKSYSYRDVEHGFGLSSSVPGRPTDADRALDRNASAGSEVACSPSCDQSKHTYEDSPICFVCGGSRGTTIASLSARDSDNVLTVRAGSINEGATMTIFEPSTTGECAAKAMIS